MIKSFLKWSSESPRREGYWWYRADNDSEASIVRVVNDNGEWSLLYRDLEEDIDDPEASADFVVNYLNQGRAEWCFIPEPS